MSRTVLALIALAIATPAQAQSPTTPQWFVCVDQNLQHEAVLSGPVAARAVAVAVHCRPYWRGLEGDDVHPIVTLIEGRRKDAGDIVIGPATPLPPGDKRF